MGPLTTRDRRALLILGGVAVLFLADQAGVFSFSRTERGSLFTPAVELAEKRLHRLQEVAVQKPRVAAEAESAGRVLAEAEKGLLRAATPAQASAEMQQIMKDLLGSQGISLRSSEFGAVRAVGDDYAQVPLTVGFSCAIEQWINLMAVLRNAAPVLSSSEVTVGQADIKNKLVNVRMIVAGYIPASLLGKPKGGSS